MAIKDAAATVPLNPGERLNGLNRIAELRAKVFDLSIGSKLERFTKDMRDPRDINNKQNKRAPAAILFMAKAPVGRYSISINELITDEKRELIKAMNHFRVVVNLLPRRLTILSQPTDEISDVSSLGIPLPKFRRIDYTQY